MQTESERLHVGTCLPAVLAGFLAGGALTGVRAVLISLRDGLIRLAAVPSQAHRDDTCPSEGSRPVRR